MKLADAEARLGITLPERHRQAMLDHDDPIHEWCDFLVPDSPYEVLRWVEVNERLHAPDQWKSWPPFLVAFASNGCGDYFAYDLRSDPHRIIYIDPLHTIAEDLEAEDKLEYGSFEEWYAAQNKPNTNWPFDQPPDCAVITLRPILFDNAPILHVTHDEDDHSWQFLGLEDADMEQAAVACLSHIVELDPSLLKIADLPLGWHAWRKSKSSPWQREPNPDNDVT